MSLFKHKINILHSCSHWQRWKVLSKPEEQAVPWNEVAVYGPIEGTFLRKDNYYSYFWVTKADRVRAMQKRPCSACVAASLGQGNGPRLGPSLGHRRRKKMDYVRLRTDMDLSGEAAVAVLRTAEHRHQYFHMLRLLRQNPVYSLLLLEDVFTRQLLHIQEKWA